MELRRVMEQESIDRVGYRKPVTVPLDVTVAQALDLMQRRRVGCLLVVEEGRLMGIFTERDVLRRVLAPATALEVPIAEVMTRDPVVARRGEPLAQVLSRMFAGGFRHLPLLEAEDHIVGTISIKRLIRFIADHCPRVYNLPPQPGHYAPAREGA